MLYYLLIGGGLMLAAWGQALGETLMLCAVLALLLSVIKQQDLRAPSREGGGSVEKDVA